VCTDLQTDPNNCGGCAVVCNAQPCLAGTCVFPGVYGSSWFSLASAPNSVVNGGFSDFTPPGSTGLYTYAANPSGTSGAGGGSGTGVDAGSDASTILGFARYDPTNGWSTLPTPPAPIVGDFGAWVGDTLYAFGSSEVMAYSVDAGSWSTALGISTDVAPLSQHAHDGAGNVYAVTNTGDIFEYSIPRNSGGPLGLPPLTPVFEPRVAWDAVSGLLYVVPSLNSYQLYSIDPISQQQASLSFPNSGGTFMTRAFCSDRSGYLYAGTVQTGQLWQYTVLTDMWTQISYPPFSDTGNGSCTVSDEGWLYYGDGAGYVGQLPLLPALISAKPSG
jgi:hypothetical protein